jgi:hypothetical protein
MQAITGRANGTAQRTFVKKEEKEMHRRKNGRKKKEYDDVAGRSITHRELGMSCLRMVVRITVDLARALKVYCQ